MCIHYLQIVPLAIIATSSLNLGVLSLTSDQAYNKIAYLSAY